MNPIPRQDGDGEDLGFGNYPHGRGTLPPSCLPPERPARTGIRLSFIVKLFCVAVVVYFVITALLRKL